MSGAIFDDLADWIQNHNRIQFAPLSNGGWERWAQIDFSIYLNSIGTTTITEDPCFAGSNQIDDMTVIQQGNDEPGAVMELKVLNSSDTIASYKAKLVTDATKLQQQLKPARAGFTKCSYGLASYTMLLPQLQAAFPGQNINANNYVGFLAQMIPSHQVVSETSANGSAFAVSFLRVP
ncbi:hypothetical protein IMZ48_40015 [Candidatus Bathyarchaeota archaeon]|nr:hypothetical protein [Candidatus Bathyarchaeota archaeon]